ncbi:MAG: PEGA domain-containing protein [Candidatus Beckwithbacteria bacterium]|nr:PEGA domain-containing protein [Patescibacteria group bacterium]
MKRTLNYFFLITFSLLLAGCSILPGSKKSALSVTTSPKATIFLDGEHLGSTPYYNEKLKSGQYVLKIVPESTGQALNPWEGRITLSPSILTVVNRELGLTADSSSGEILSFEPLADKNATSISVVTTPDGAVVNLDGEPKGFAPLSIDNISEGDHVLVITSPGFKQKTIKAKTVKGNKLIASVQLARDTSDIIEEEKEQEATPSATPKASPKATPSATPKASPKATSSDDPARPYVEINSPDTGWVNVRSEASTTGGDDTILTKVDHGEKFPLVDTTVNGWYQIEYETGKEGWISGKYAEKFE